MCPVPSEVVVDSGRPGWTCRFRRWNNADSLYTQSTRINQSFYLYVSTYHIKWVLLELGRNLNATWTIQKNCSTDEWICIVGVCVQACRHDGWKSISVSSISEEIAMSVSATLHPITLAFLELSFTYYSSTSTPSWDEQLRNKRPIEHAFAAWEKINYCEILKKDISMTLLFDSTKTNSNNSMNSSPGLFQTPSLLWVVMGRNRNAETPSAYHLSLNEYFCGWASFLVSNLLWLLW